MLISNEPDVSRQSGTRYETLNWYYRGKKYVLTLENYWRKKTLFITLHWNLFAIVADRKCLSHILGNRNQISLLVKNYNPPLISIPHLTLSQTCNPDISMRSPPDDVTHKIIRSWLFYLQHSQITDKRNSNKQNSPSKMTGSVCNIA